MGTNRICQFRGFHHRRAGVTDGHKLFGRKIVKIKIFEINCRLCPHKTICVCESVLSVCPSVFLTLYCILASQPASQPVFVQYEAVKMDPHTARRESKSYTR